MYNEWLGLIELIELNYLILVENCLDKAPWILKICNIFNNFKAVFLGIYNCAYWTHFCKSGHILFDVMLLILPFLYANCYFIPSCLLKGLRCICVITYICMILFLFRYQNKINYFSCFHSFDN